VDWQARMALGGALEDAVAIGKGSVLSEMVLKHDSNN